MQSQIDSKLVAAKYEKTLIPIDKWLNTIGLRQHLTVFNKTYKNVQDMVHLSESDLKNLGIKTGADRARIASSLYLLRERMQGRVVRKHDNTGSPIGSNRSTPTHTPPSMVNHPDYDQLNQQYQPFHFGPTQPQLSKNPTDFLLHNQKEINKYLWYHGGIPWVKAENLLKSDGDFLVRDSTSQKGDYVLTCRWNRGPLHFMINRQSIVDESTGISKCQYQFEDVLRDTVHQLISYYVKDRKHVSEASKALITNPVNRRISADSLFINSNVSNSTNSRAVDSNSSIFTGASSQDSVTGVATTRRKFKRTGSQPLLSIDDGEDDFMDNSELVRLTGGKTSSTVNKNKYDHKSQGMLSSTGVVANNQTPNVPAKILRTGASSSHHIRSGSEPVLITGSKLHRGVGVAASSSQCKSTTTTQGGGTINHHPRLPSSSSDSDLTKPPPPKPSRIPTIKLNKKDSSQKRPIVTVRNKQLYEEENDYSDYDAIKSWPENVARAANPGPIFSSLTDLYDSPKGALRLRNSDARSSGSSTSHSSHDSGYITQEPTYNPVAIKHPDLNPTSKFDIHNYNSQILTPNNKPLENSAQSLILPMLLGANARTLALHMTVLDLDLLKIIGDHDFGLGVKSGLELITLPHGYQLRRDILERFHCMKLFVATTILLCVNYTERAKMLHQWIQVAQTMKTQCGNLFGFAYVMEGVTFEQIKRLKNTWIAAKYHHQTSTLLYDTKLQFTYKSLCEAGNALPLQNISLPYILPLVDLLERDNTDQEPSFLWENPEMRSDMGMDIILAHLDIARIITEQHGLYKVTSLNIIGSFKPTRDMLELFDTRMHMRFLWGSKGVGVASAERYSKFMQILTAMSYQRESTQAISKESSL